jgi:hypothetical protein
LAFRHLYLFRKLLLFGVFFFPNLFQTCVSQSSISRLIQPGSGSFVRECTNTLRLQSRFCLFFCNNLSSKETWTSVRLDIFCFSAQFSPAQSGQATMRKFALTTCTWAFSAGLCCIHYCNFSSTCWLDKNLRLNYHSVTHVFRLVCW